MNTNTRIPLKQVLITEAQALNGMAVSKKTFVAKIVAKCPEYSKGYVGMLLNKCIVNNPNRSHWGQVADLFAETENHFLVSSGKRVADYRLVPEDKEYIRSRRELHRTEITMIIETYLQGANFAVL